MPSEFDKFDDLQIRLKHPLRIQVSDEHDARAKIPGEIYTDPTKTGWEEMEE